MSNINFTCPHCSFQKQLPASAEGMQGNCPSCKAVVTIRADAPANPAVLPQHPLQQQPLQQQPLQQQPLQQQPLQQQPLQQQPLQQQPIGWSTPPLPKEPRQKSQTHGKSDNKQKFVIVGSAIGIFILLITVSLFFLLGGDESASTSDSPSERQVATDSNDDGGSGMGGSGETGVRGAMSGDTNPIGGSTGNALRGGKDPLAALNGHWKRTHFYKHDDNDMKDGSMGRMAEDLSDAVFRSKTWSMYYDSARKVWAQVYPDGTIERGTFDVLPDENHPGRFNMKVIYGDGSGDWTSNSYYLSNSNRQLDDQWIRKFGDGPNAERWVYVDGKTSP